MDKKSKKMFNDAFNNLSWNVILNFYESSEYESDFIKKHGKSKSKIGLANHVRTSITKNLVKEELTNLLEFMLTNNISHFETDRWILICDAEMLEIIFAPTKGRGFNGKYEVKPEDEDINYDEIGILQELLDKSVSEENFELSAVLRDRINDLKLVPKAITYKNI